MHNPIDCSNESLRDLLPEYVLGTLTSAEYSAVSAHLTGCEACVDEVQLIRSAGAVYPMPVIDIEAVVAALPAAPARAKPMLTASSGGGAAAPASGALRTRQWRLAAAISFIVIGGISLATLRGVMRQSAASDVPIAVVASSMPVLSSGPAPLVVASAIADPSNVSPADLEAVGARRIGAAGLSIGAAADLSDAQLQRLLSELETVQALPSIEPALSHHPMTAPDSPEDKF